MNVAVIGAGPAGMMAAGRAAELGHSVVLFEANEKAGKKLYITGKGRCNVTNLCDPEEFLRHVVANPKFLSSALRRWTPSDTVQFLEQNGVKWKEERGRRVFPQSDKASDVTKALERYLEKTGVRRVYETRLVDLETDGSAIVRLTTNQGVYTEFDHVILACGGAVLFGTGCGTYGRRRKRYFGSNSY